MSALQQPRRKVISLTMLQEEEREYNIIDFIQILKSWTIGDWLKKTFNDPPWLHGVSTPT